MPALASADSVAVPDLQSELSVLNRATIVKNLKIENNHIILLDPMLQRLARYVKV